MRRGLQNQPYKFQTLLQRWKYKEMKAMEFSLQFYFESCLVWKANSSSEFVLDTTIC